MRDWKWQQISLSGPMFWTRLLPSEALALQQLASSQRVLEIGGGYGYSACAMALAGAKHVVSVDPHEPHKDNDYARYGDTHDSMKDSLTVYGLQYRVEIVKATSAEYIGNFSGEEKNGFGLILIDGDTDRQQVSGDIQGCVTMLKPGGRMVVTNYGDPDFGATETVDWLFGVDGYRAAERHVYDGENNLVVLVGVQAPRK